MPEQLNILTVDLEEWFVVEILREKYPFEQWPALPSRVQENSYRLLDLFNRKHVRATWFVLGWCAERYPRLISDIAAEGHEIACHSYQHRRVDQLTPETFREDTQRALEAIQQASGVRPFGYRAPSWSINASIPWAFEILGELGFDYDSSIFPIKHDLYGIPDGPRQLFKMSLSEGRYLFELPASTVRLFGRNLPVTGGGYLRHSPFWFSRQMVKRLNNKGIPAVIYIHPWEFDPNPPKANGLSLSQSFRTYGSTDIFGLKLEQLLSEFNFTTVIDYLGSFTRQKIGFER
ncbi:MAG: DUF3473 domain-containing protein [candidate division Zixibacteria bacterium]|nr:DUF3473 domain-containing protein [candidate division Zixibacteria bacterium]